jgi:hypothetical protein
MTASAKGAVDKPGTDVAAKAGLNRAILDPAPESFLNVLCIKAEEAGVRSTCWSPEGIARLRRVRVVGKRSYMLGERCSSADVLWGTALTWTTRFKLAPEQPKIAASILPWTAVKAMDAELAAAPS